MKIFSYFSIAALSVVLLTAGCTAKDNTTPTEQPVSSDVLVTDFTVQLKPTAVNTYGNLDQGDVLITNTSKNATSFKWDFGDNSGPQTISTNQFTHTYAHAGTYKIRLTATGSQGSKTVEKNVSTIAGGVAIFHCSNTNANYPLTVTCDGKSLLLQSSRLNCSSCCSTPQNYTNEIALFGLKEGLNPYTVKDRFGLTLSATDAKVAVTPKNCAAIVIQ